MGITIIAFLIIIALPAVVAFFISLGVLIRLKNKEHKNAKMISIITFVCCFVTFVAAVFYSLSFIRLDR